MVDLAKLMENRTPEQVVAEHREFMDELALCAMDRVRKNPAVAQAISGKLGFTDADRVKVLRRVEFARARRLAPLVRAAGETPINAAAPGITPDTVWTGDYTTLLELFRISQYRINTEAAYVSGRVSRCQTGFLGTRERAHVEP